MTQAGEDSAAGPLPAVTEREVVLVRRFPGALTVAIACVLMAAALSSAGCGEKKATEVPAGESGNSGGGVTVTLVSPVSGPPGTIFEVKGSGFGAAKGTSKLQFDGNAIGVKTWSDTEIVATVPFATEAGVYEMTIVTDEGTTEAGKYTVE